MVLTAGVLILACRSAVAASLCVATNGNDSHPGTDEKPFASRRSTTIILHGQRPTPQAVLSGDSVVPAVLGANGQGVARGSSLPYRRRGWSTWPGKHGHDSGLTPVAHGLVDHRSGEPDPDGKPRAEPRSFSFSLDAAEGELSVAVAEPYLLSPSFEVEPPLRRDFLGRVRGRGHFDTDLGRDGATWRIGHAGPALSRDPRHIRHPHAVGGVDRTLGNHLPPRHHPIQQGGNVSLQGATFTSMRAHEDPTEMVQLHFVRQIAQATIVAHFQPRHARTLP